MARALTQALGKKVTGVGLAFAAFHLTTTNAPAAELEWDADETCDSAVYVRAQVEDLLGQPFGEVEDGPFHVKVRQAKSEEWSAVVTLTDARTGERRLRRLNGATCAEVSEAVAVAIAMAIQTGRDGASTGESPDAPSTDPGPPASATATHSTPPTRAKPKTPRDADVRIAAAAGLVIDAGVLPSLAPGAEVDASFGLGVLRATTLLNYFVPQEARVSAGGGGRFDLILAGLLACLEQPPPNWNAIGCVGFEVGRLRGEGIEVDGPRGGTVLWTAARVDFSIIFPLGPSLGLRARAGALLPFSRPEFLLDGTDRVHRPAALGGRASLGLEFRL